MKTPDEIKDELLKECRDKYGILGCWFEECMNKAFSLGIEEGKQQERQYQLSKIEHQQGNICCQGCFKLGVEEGLKKRGITTICTQTQKEIYKKACKDIINILKNNPSFNPEEFIWLIRKLQEGQYGN